MTLETKFDIIIYHDRCPDGIAAAWPFWRNPENAKSIYIGYHYGLPPPTDIEGKTIVIVDFSFPRADLMEMHRKAKKILILDHHASSQRDCINLENVISDDGHRILSCIFDMSRSGAQIAWDYAYPGKPRPWFVEVIADRDLWKWENPHSKPVSKALYLQGCYTFDMLEEFYLTLENQEEYIKYYTKLGEMYMAQEEKDISSICTRAILANMKLPNGEQYNVKLTECSSQLRSEVGNRLSVKDCDFAVLWQYDFESDAWWISLRSTSDKVDLSAIAKCFYNGGGHRRAAGFTIQGRKGENLHTYFTALRPRKLDAPRGPFQSQDEKH